MKSHAILMVVALVVQAFLTQAARAAEELASPPEAAGPTVEIGPLPGEFECPCEESGSPLTLMQWSYGDGADFEDSLGGAIETDRPYFTKTASVVGRSNWQLESGYSYWHNDDRGRRESLHSLPEALLRVGVLAEWLEFRIGWTWLEHDSNRYYIRDLSGATDLNVGIKIALTPQDEMLPETAIVINTDLPSSLFQVDPNFAKMQAGFEVVYRWDLNGGYAAGGQTGFQRALSYQGPYILFSQSWIVEREFTDSLTGFAEWFMLSPDTEVRAPSQHYLDGGILFLITDNIQLDAAVGCGLTSATTDYFVRSGFSIRW